MRTSLRSGEKSTSDAIFYSYLAWICFKVEDAFRNPLPPNNKSEFVNNFEFVGTIDNTSYLVTPDAIEFREKVCGGENAIMEYCHKLAKEGGNTVAKILGTRIMDNSTGTLTKDSCLVNVLLPLEISPSKIAGKHCIDPGHGAIATEWMQEALIEDFNTFMPIYFFQGQWWTRLSAQIYLELSDFEWAGAALKAICERAGRGEFLNVVRKFESRGQKTESSDLLVTGLGIGKRYEQHFVCEICWNQEHRIDSIILEFRLMYAPFRLA